MTVIKMTKKTLPDDTDDTSAKDSNAKTRKDDAAGSEDNTEQARKDVACSQGVTHKYVLVSMSHDLNMDTNEVQLILKEKIINSARKMYKMDYPDNSSGLWKGYFPKTDVLDHGAIDGDQSAMEVAISGKTVYHFEAVKNVYKQSGNSKYVATLILRRKIGRLIQKYHVVWGLSIGGAVVTVTTYSEFDIGSRLINVKYTPMTCLIWDLHPEGCVDSGCFTRSGEISIEIEIPMEYNSILTDNKNKRTLQDFSTTVECKMSKEETAIAFLDYYGEGDYANQCAQAAFVGGKTTFNLGDADFTEMGLEGKEQIIKRGITYMNVLLYTLHKFESTIVKCNSSVDPLVYTRDSFHVWDEWVAFFVRNLDGIDGSSNGKLVYVLVNKRCQNFAICGASGDEATGGSQVNLQFIDKFNQGNKELVYDECDAAEVILYDIKDIMGFPLIQSTLIYAYKGENEVMRKQ